MRRQSCIPTLLTALLLTLVSQQSLAESDSYSDHSPSVWVAQTATPAGRVRVTITKTKPKLHLAKSQRSIAKLFADNSEDDYYDDLPDLQIGYRRPELVNTTAEVADLSDDIKIRLALARLKALKRYEEVWG